MRMCKFPKIRKQYAQTARLSAVVSRPGPGRERIVDVALWRERNSNLG